MNLSSIALFLQLDAHRDIVHAWLDRMRHVRLHSKGYHVLQSRGYYLDNDNDWKQKYDFQQGMFVCFTQRYEFVVRGI